MLKKIIKFTEYEIVSEFYANGDSSSVAKTIVEKGKAVNTYRLCVGSNNPLTQVAFDKNELALQSYLATSDPLLWDVYWADPVKEAE